MVAAQIKTQPDEANESTIKPARPPGRLGATAKFTVDDAFAMVQSGIVPEDSTVELLDGELVYVDRLGKESNTLGEANHRFVISAFAEVNERLRSPARHLRTQGTLICNDEYAPVSDAIVLRGTRQDFRRRVPRANDALSVIDVSESTYAKDSGEKLAAYARAQLPQHAIIDLNNRNAEVYADPDVAAGAYRTKVTIAADGSLPLRVGEADEAFDVPLAELLP